MLPNNLVEMLYQTVQRYPDQTALMWKENGKYVGSPYHKLWDVIRGFANGLRQMGIEKESKVAIFSENNPHWLISDFAILSLGAVSVPIYPTLTGKQVSIILEDADVEIAIVQNADMVKRIKIWPSSIRHIILMEDHPVKHPLVVPFNQVVQNPIEDDKEKWEWQHLTHHDLATIVYTSGTTGQPKGVMLSHENLLSNVIGSQHYIPVTHRDLTLSFLPLSHIFERTCNQFTAMYTGATIAYAENLTTVPQNLLEVKPTIITSVPRLYEKVYSQLHQQLESSSVIKRFIFRWAYKVAQERTNYQQLGFGTPIPWKIEARFLLAKVLVFSKLSSKLGGRMRLMVSGGASLDPEISLFFSTIGLPILEGYGMTECSPVVSTNPITRSRSGTVGLPLPHTEVRLSDDGELIVKSPSVMMGYYKLPEESKKILEYGWLHTGDIAEIDTDGYIRIVDRKKNILVLSTGKNVTPQPIERTLCTSPFIHQVVLLGNNRKYVTALIVPDFENMFRTAHQQGWKNYDSTSLIHSPEARSFIEKEIKRLLKDFAPYEKPKKFALLPHEFTIENGELTPTLKVRLKEVEKKYATLISTLYEEKSENETAVSIDAINTIQEDIKDKSLSNSKSISLGQNFLQNPQFWLGILLGIVLGVLVRFILF